MTERKVMCGIGVEAREIVPAAGYTLILDNPEGRVQSVSVDITGSSNLAINETSVPGVQFMSPREILVTLEPNVSGIEIPIFAIQKSEGISLALSVAPGESCTSETLQCGCMLNLRQLANLEGYVLTVDNPLADTSFDISFDFSHSDNLKVYSDGSARQKDGKITLHGLAPLTLSAPLARIITVDKTAPIQLRYAVEHVATPVK